MRSKLVNIILSPYLFALILTIIAIALLPSYFKKYKAEVISEGKTTGNEFIGYYVDLDGDSITEQVYFKYNRLNEGAFTVRDCNLKTIRQWNLPGVYKIIWCSFIVGDFDNNRFKEIYTCFLRNDSLFLGYCEPLKYPDREIDQVFIDTVCSGIDIEDIEVKFSSIYDFNKDGFAEVLFTIIARYSLQPIPLLQDIAFNPEMFTSLIPNRGSLKSLLLGVTGVIHSIVTTMVGA